MGSIPAIALGFAYMIPLHCGWAYFPNHRGKVNGIISMAFGMSVLPFNPIATHLANPDDLKASIDEKTGSQTFHYFTADVADRAPSMLRWLALIYLIQGVTGALFISHPDEQQPSSLQ